MQSIDGVIRSAGDNLSLRSGRKSQCLREAPRKTVCPVTGLLGRHWEIRCPTLSLDYNTDPFVDLVFSCLSILFGAIALVGIHRLHGRDGVRIEWVFDRLCDVTENGAN